MRIQVYVHLLVLLAIAAAGTAFPPGCVQLAGVPIFQVAAQRLQRAGQTPAGGETAAEESPTGGGSINYAALTLVMETSPELLRSVLTTLASRSSSSSSSSSSAEAEAGGGGAGSSLFLSRSPSVFGVGGSGSIPDVSLVGRIGQNSDVNGEYKFLEVEPSSQRPVYIKVAFVPAVAALRGSAAEEAADASSGGGGRLDGAASVATPAASEPRTAAARGAQPSAGLRYKETPLFLYSLKSDERSGQDLWAIGERPFSSKSLRAFAASAAPRPEFVESPWSVFEEDDEAARVVVREDLFLHAAAVSCINRARDGDEEGVDCGGNCRRCSSFASCRLPALPPATFAFGACPRDGLLAHGALCEYSCPIGWRARGGVGRLCYDGTLLEIGNAKPCVSIFPSTPCPYLELSGSPSPSHSFLDGTYVSYSASGRGGQESLLWQREVLDPATSAAALGVAAASRAGLPLQVFLFWRDGHWVLASFADDVKFALLPDKTPERFTDAGEFDPLVLAQGIKWLPAAGASNSPPSSSSAPFSMKCVAPVAAAWHRGLHCPTLLVDGWDLPALNGRWVMDAARTGQLPKNDAKENAQEEAQAKPRPRFVKEEEGLHMYWTSRGYWVIDADENPGEFVAFTFSAAALPPSPSDWLRWGDEEGKWIHVRGIAATCSDTPRTDGSEATAQAASDSPPPDPPSSPSASAAGQPVGVALVRATSLFPDSLLSAVLDPRPSTFALQPASLSRWAAAAANADSAAATAAAAPCFRLELNGAIGKGRKCNGAWTQVLSLDQTSPGAFFYSRGAVSARAGGAAAANDRPGTPLYWYKLQPDSTVLYLYWMGGDWVCTSNDGSVLGYLPDRRAHPSRQAAGPTAFLHGQQEAIDGQGMWASAAGFAAHRTQLRCIVPSLSQSEPCGRTGATVAVSGFADSAAVLNGEYALVPSPQAAAHPSAAAADGYDQPNAVAGLPRRYVKRVSPQADGAKLEGALVLRYNLQGLWMIEEEVAAEPSPARPDGAAALPMAFALHSPLYSQTDGRLASAAAQPTSALPTDTSSQRDSELLLPLDEAAIGERPYVAYLYSDAALLPSGVWTVFDRARNRAVMHAVDLHCLHERALTAAAAQGATQADA
eukprot:GHVT01090143.1.p1 GENE.GHVT01090143.1~~GHVT01090143.1.p1  ORF type:complete len:1117 (+),score=360.51 GHVT01090143.1:152-3502(+)